MVDWDDEYVDWEAYEEEEYAALRDGVFGERMAEYARRRHEEANAVSADEFMLACAAGDAALVARCLDLGAGPDVIAATTLAMSTASGLGHVEVVSALLDRGISPFQRRPGLDPLHAACRNGRPEVVRLLLDRGASAYGVEHRLLRRLLRGGADAVIPHPDGWHQVDSCPCGPRAPPSRAEGSC